MDTIEAELEDLENELTFQTDPDRQMRIALMIESRRIELGIEDAP